MHNCALTKSLRHNHSCVGQCRHLDLVIPDLQHFAQYLCPVIMSVTIAFLRQGKEGFSGSGLTRKPSLYESNNALILARSAVKPSSSKRSSSKRFSLYSDATNRFCTLSRECPIKRCITAYTDIFSIERRRRQGARREGRVKLILPLELNLEWSV